MIFVKKWFLSKNGSGYNLGHFLQTQTHKKPGRQSQFYETVSAEIYGKNLIWGNLCL
jgi:hypothetical protein